MLEFVALSEKEDRRRSEDFIASCGWFSIVNRSWPWDSGWLSARCAFEASAGDADPEDGSLRLGEADWDWLPASSARGSMASGGAA
jgi:hypothetical protein